MKALIGHCKTCQRPLYCVQYLYPIQIGDNKLGEITYLTKATSKNKSLRTTVPISIVNQFELTDKDKLNWILKADNNELIIVVRLVKDNVEIIEK